ncbi:hypothetical protein [Shinella kummerowiae]|uniref:hypothetical protein n=1 Tax=Shinella kummerowiae TaxID=417745 RepID=UPI0021B5B57D|nr:hypothetical protein [Shinella kummerowiae]MCT7663129.1 hypothetical protein [Shinella kummerowiae]
MALKPIMISTPLTSVAELMGIDPRELENAFICEDWSAELATGLVRLGPQAAALHDIPNVRCGIMDLIQRYEPADRQKVMLALEEAATIATTFSFATAIRADASLYRPVFCFGRSYTEDGISGAIHATFAIARHCLAMAATSRGPLN